MEYGTSKENSLHKKSKSQLSFDTKHLFSSLQSRNESIKNEFMLSYNRRTRCYDELCSDLIALSKVLGARKNNDCASRAKEKVL